MGIRTALDDLTAVPYTTAQIDARIQAVDAKLFKIMFPTDSLEDDGFAGADYEEHGDAGHKLEMGKLLDALLRMKEQLLKMRKDPGLTDDFVYLVSQFDNPYL